MMTIQSHRGAPTLEEAARLLKVAVEHLDAEFGVVLIDPTRHLYTVLVDAGTASAEADGVQGPYSNPRIAPFGRPR